MTQEAMKKKRKPALEGFIKAVERGGNKLPHPLTLFTILAALVLILSYVLSKAGASVTYTTATAEGAKEVTVVVTNLLEKAELQKSVIGFVDTYIRFFPIGLIVVMMLGVSIAEKAGLITAVMKKLVAGAPPYLVTFIVALVGICANLASDAGIVFAPAIGGAVFFALRRHPLAGMFTGYVAAYGGFSANMLIAGTDALLAGITQSAVASFHIEAPVHPLMNWYVMMGSSLMLALLVTIVTEKIITPILGDFNPVDPEMKALRDEQSEFTATESEIKGLKAAGVATLIFVAVMVLLMVPEGAFFRADNGDILPNSPFTRSLLTILFAFFAIVGIAYGRAAGTIKSGADVAKYMQSGLVGVAGFLVVCLPASMFVTWFGKSNMAVIFAVKGAHLLQEFNLTGIPLILMFVLLCAVMNLFITSGTTKWMILAPIFVPMFAMMTISPAATQMAYRIGDSTTNIISPVSAYLPVMLGMMERYKSEGQEFGIGSVISLTLPYSIILLICWTIFFGLWLYLGWPMGPGVPTFLS